MLENLRKEALLCTSNIAILFGNLQKSRRNHTLPSLFNLQRTIVNIYEGKKKESCSRDFSTERDEITAERKVHNA